MRSKRRLGSVGAVVVGWACVAGGDLPCDAPRSGRSARAETQLSALRVQLGQAVGIALPAVGDDLAPGPVVPDVLDLGGGRALEVARGEVLLRFAAALDEAGVREACARHGLTLVQRGRDTWRARLADTADLAATLAALRVDRDFAVAGPNAIARGAGRGRGQSDWRHVEWDSAGRTPGTRWSNRDLADGDRRPVVALLDSGVAFEDHVDALGTYRRAPDLRCTPFVDGHDFVNGDAHPNDDHQHGTHLAALIAGAPRCGSPLSGHAPGVAILPIKVLDASLAGTEMMLVEGLHLAVDRGADVVNMSLAFGPEYFPSPALSDALVRAHEEGVALVAAAGNDGANGRVAWPAAGRDVIAVGAFRLAGRDVREEVRAEYSQTGPALDVLAAGGDLDLDVNADGHADGIAAQTFAPGDPTAFGYWVGAGTSQAAAAVSALAARLVARGASGSEVRALLVRNADRDDFTAEAGRGAVRPDVAERAARCERCGPVDLPVAYVNPVGALEAAGDDVRAVVAVQVVGADERPLAGVTVWGHFVGAASGDARCTTDAEGRCRVASAAVDVAGGGVLVGFHADTVVVRSRGEDLPVAPLGFFRMDAAAAEGIQAAFEDRPAGLLAFIVDPAGDDARTIFGSEALVPSAMVKNLGPANAASPFVLVFDPPFGARFGLASPVDVEGGGLGASSLDWNWYRSWKMDPDFGGLGLGASSLNWGWYGLWSWNLGGAGLGASSLDAGWFRSWTLLFGGVGSGLGGAGLGASSLGWPFGWSFYLPSFGGAGLGASSLVLNDYARLVSSTGGAFWSTWGTGLGASSLSGAFNLLSVSSSWLGGFDLTGKQDGGEAEIMGRAGCGLEDLGPPPR